MATPTQPFLDAATERLKKSLEHLGSEVRGIRTGRAMPGLIENVKVDYYGSRTPLSQIATITVPDPRSLLVKPFDPSSIKDIEKAIQASDLGLNPSVEAKAIRILIPPLSEDQRKKLAGRVKSLAEETRVSMRNVRRDVLKELETAADDKKRSVAITEDELERAKDKVQGLLKEYEKKVDELVAAKTKEIMEV
ncbi:MAG: ribosome recycling factor [Planctomycetota bacterium]|nr:MAG: ribosome recycling factor [Planctomycetota bacterium]